MERYIGDFCSFSSRNNQTSTDYPRIVELFIVLKSMAVLTTLPGQYANVLKMLLKDANTDIQLACLELLSSQLSLVKGRGMARVDNQKQFAQLIFDVSKLPSHESLLSNEELLSHRTRKVHVEYLKVTIEYCLVKFSNATDVETTVLNLWRTCREEMRRGIVGENKTYSCSIALSNSIQNLLSSITKSKQQQKQSKENVKPSMSRTTGLTPASLSVLHTLLLTTIFNDIMQQLKAPGMTNTWEELIVWDAFLPCLIHVPLEMFDDSGFFALNQHSSNLNNNEAICRAGTIVYLVQNGIFDKVSGRKELEMTNVYSWLIHRQRYTAATLTNDDCDDDNKALNKSVQRLSINVAECIASMSEQFQCHCIKQMFEALLVNKNGLSSTYCFELLALVAAFCLSSSKTANQMVPALVDSRMATDNTSCLSSLLVAPLTLRSNSNDSSSSATFPSSFHRLCSSGHASKIIIQLAVNDLALNLSTVCAHVGENFTELVSNQALRLCAKYQTWHCSNAEQNGEKNDHHEKKLVNILRQFAMKSHIGPGSGQFVEIIANGLEC